MYKTVKLAFSNTSYMVVISYIHFISLTTPDSWSRRGIASRNWIVDVDQDTRIRSLISTREGN
jgi:hypothetical protein